MPDSSKLENAADDMQSKLMEDEDLRSSVKEAVSLKSGCAKALAAKVSVHGSFGVFISGEFGMFVSILYVWYRPQPHHWVQ